MAGFVIFLGGPIAWMSKRQTFTARSSAEAEIGSVDECTKVIQQLRNIFIDLNLYDTFFTKPIPIYNDNAATVQWSHNMSTKGLRYIQIRENAVREQVQSGLIDVRHIEGKRNPTDIMTKEDRDVGHFCECSSMLVVPLPE